MSIHGLKSLCLHNKANDNFQRQMGNLANMFRVFGTVGSNMVGD